MKQHLHSTTASGRVSFSPARIIRALFLAFIVSLATSMAANALTITVRMGRQSQDCRGFGICSITIERTQIGSEMSANARLEGNQLHLALTEARSDQQDLIAIDEPISLSRDIARQIGADSLVILPGEYYVDYSSNPYGDVVVPVQRFGITIHIEVGRRSRDCKGFGICSITTDIDLLSHPTPAYGELHGRKLKLSLGSSSGYHEDQIVIDEAITVDHATARALGVATLVIRPGSYRVDYTYNPNGDVVVDVEPSGLTIWVGIGRRWGVCHGFGICGIVIDNRNLESNYVRTIGSLDGNSLTLQFNEGIPADSTEITIDEAIELDRYTAKGLGARHLSIKAGTYPITRTPTGEAVVVLPVERLGIVITIEPGRRSRNCTGFGICSITIDLELRTGMPMIISGDSTGIDMLFAESTTEETFYIDEPIIIDVYMAARLGVPAGTIRPGAYVLDRSEYANGTVRLGYDTDGSVADVDNNAGITDRAVVQPNPVTSNATINFSLQSASAVTIDLIDSRGSLVRRLVESPNMPAGDRSVNFDVTSLASGTYFWAIRTSTGLSTGSVVVTR